jgi:antitoxin HicB
MPRYTVVLEPEEDEVGGYVVSVPALPGCLTQGRTVDEAVERAREAISLRLRVMRRDGESFPPDVVPIVVNLDVEPAPPGPIDPALLANLDADEVPAGLSPG